MPYPKVSLFSPELCSTSTSCVQPWPSPFVMEGSTLLHCEGNIAGPGCREQILPQAHLQFAAAQRAAEPLLLSAELSKLNAE